MKKIEFPILAENVAAMLPQKEPFVLVSSILEASEKGCKTSFDIPLNHVLVFDQKLCAAGIIENIAQSCAAMMGAVGRAKGEGPKVGFIGDVRSFFCTKLPNAGSQLQTEITIENQIFDVMMIEGKVYHQNELIAGGKMKIFVKADS